MANVISENINSIFSPGAGFFPLIDIGTSYELGNKEISEKEVIYQRGIRLIASNDYQFIYWNQMLNALKEIKEEIYENEIAPTELAEENIKKLLHAAFEKLGIRLQIPNFIPTGLGGVEAEWKKGNRYLQLICPPTEEKKPYLFFKENDKYGIEEFENFDEFIKRVSWLIEN